MDGIEQRLVEVEMALAHAERQGEELSEVVRGQGARIDLLVRQVEALARRLREAEEAASAGLGTPAADVRPPHW